MSSPSRLPLYLVTGFLGSGKTTLLGRIASELRHRDLVFIVNELSRVDVDGRYLAQSGAAIVPIPGGSIFCRCLVSSFVTHLKEILTWRDSGRAPVDGVVVEASGIANPGVVSTLLGETGLDARLTLERVIAVVDPVSFAKLVDTLPNVVAQARAADLLLVNKADLVSEEALVAVERQLRAINPTAALERTVRCQTSRELLAGPNRSAPAGDYAACADPSFATVELPLAEGTTAELLRAGIAELGPDLYRLKGAVRCDDGLCLVNGSQSGLELTDADRLEPTGLVLVVRGGATVRPGIFTAAGEPPGRSPDHQPLLRLRARR